MRRQRVPFLVVLLTTAALLPGCKRNAATGDVQVNFLSRDQEIAMGLEARPEIVASYGGEVADPVMSEYVTGVGMSLAQHTEADFPSLPWQFTVLNSDVINAFALPGGQVFISRGLAAQLDDEAALAGVLGHEIGHVTAEHVDARLGRQFGLAVVAGAASAAAGQSDSQLAGMLVQGGIVVGGVFNLRYDRKQEIESDKLGMRYMYEAHYDPAALLDVMRTLQEASGGGSQPEFLSTHPHPETRMMEIEDRMNSPKYAPTLNNPAYVRNADAYERNMLRRLAMLPEAPSPAFAQLAPEAWCAVCAAER